MPLISTAEDGETFTLMLLAMTDLSVIKAFKTASERSNENAAVLCLEEMTRRNLTFVLTFSPDELRAAARLARTRGACGTTDTNEVDEHEPSSRRALNWIARYWDDAADKAEAMLRSHAVH